MVIDMKAMTRRTYLLNDGYASGNRPGQAQVREEDLACGWLVNLTMSW